MFVFLFDRTRFPICHSSLNKGGRWWATLPLLLSLLGLLLAACQSMATPVQSAVPADTTTATVTEVNAAASVAPAANEATESTVPTDTTESFLPPLRLAIPALDFATAVEPMAWQVTEVDGQRQAVWEIPESSAGWHINSAGTGAAGNILISGHHRQGAAVFAALARGEVSLDDEIYLTDEAGKTFRYVVTEIAAPIPITGATEAEQERLAAYQAPSNEGKLTLITGWPDFSNTHYLVIVAQLSGELE